MPRSQRPRSGMTMNDLRYAFETNRLPRVKVIIDSYLGELRKQKRVKINHVHKRAQKRYLCKKNHPFT